jgi:SAM-dependent methyltransferase
MKMGETTKLLISESDLRRHVPGNLLRICWRQFRVERALAQRAIHFRSADPRTVAAAYAAMTEAEFDAINGRQDWANWRTIPRALSGHVLDRPLTVLDLGCGTGGSTRVLAFYCPAGSRIFGYEAAEPLVAVARRRSYVHRSGKASDVQFCCQGVCEPLRVPGQTPGGPRAGAGSGEGNWPEQSVDVVNASGIVGHHLREDTVAPLVVELERILTRGGVAMLDVGPTLRLRALIRLMTGSGFHCLGRFRSCIFDLTGQAVFCKTP